MKIDYTSESGLKICIWEIFF